MISVENHIPVKAEYRDTFEKMFAGGTRFVQDSPGFIRNEVLRPIKGEFYIIRTYWDSNENFEKWTKSQEFVKAHQNARSARDIFSGESYLTISEVISETEKQRTSAASFPVPFF